MMKEQFEDKTREVLTERWRINQGVFQRWVNEFKNEPEVTEFFALASQCAWALIDPLKNPVPNMNFGNELPANMSPEALFDIYSCLWTL